MTLHAGILGGTHSLRAAPASADASLRCSSDSVLCFRQSCTKTSW